MSYMNLVYGLVRHESLVAQWLEHPTGVCAEHRRFDFCQELRLLSLSHARDMMYI